MGAWVAHLHASPYCHAHYAVGSVQGRDVCQCGWVGPKVKPTLQGMTFGAIMRLREEESDDSLDEEDDNVDGWADYEPNTYTGT